MTRLVALAGRVTTKGCQPKAVKYLMNLTVRMTPTPPDGGKLTARIKTVFNCLPRCIGFDIEKISSAVTFNHS